MSNIVHATDADFATLLANAGERTVLVDFHASWCGPCKAMAPALQAFAQSNPEVLVVKVDIDEAPESAAAHRVRSVPTLKVMRGGQTFGQQSGAMSAAQLATLVQKAV